MILTYLHKPELMKSTANTQVVLMDWSCSGAHNNIVLAIVYRITETLHD